jgi:hypothetical protein
MRVGLLVLVGVAALGSLASAETLLWVGANTQW